MRMKQKQQLDVITKLKTQTVNSLAGATERRVTLSRPHYTFHLKPSVLPSVAITTSERKRNYAQWVQEVLLEQRKKSEAAIVQERQKVEVQDTRRKIQMVKHLNKWQAFKQRRADIIDKYLLLKKH